MWSDAAPGSTNRSKPILMPGSPAPRKNRATIDQPQAASVPTEIRVSMVAAPWRRLTQAARWNGHAPQITTGVASCSASHCQLSNCSAGIIDTRSTGSDSAAETTSRRSSGALGSGSPAGSAPSEGGAGRRAP